MCLNCTNVPIIHNYHDIPTQSVRPGMESSKPAWQKHSSSPSMTAQPNEQAPSQGSLALIVQYNYTCNRLTMVYILTGTVSAITL